MTSLMILIAALLAPTSQPTTPDAPAAQSQPFKMGEAAKVHQGAPFTIEAVTSLDDIAAKPEAFADKTVKVSGKLTSVCQKKGCWATLGGSNPTARARVTFKDYGFFAPMDGTGAMATVEGTIGVKVMSEAERAHLAEDAGKTLADIPAAELRIVATAIEVERVGH